IKAAKKKDKVYTIGDGDALYLKVTPDGVKYWVSRPTNTLGKRTTIHLGRYPEMSLSEARIANMNRTGNRGGCLVKVKQVPHPVLQVVDSNALQLRLAGC